MFGVQYVSRSLYKSIDYQCFVLYTQNYIYILYNQKVCVNLCAKILHTVLFKYLRTTRNGSTVLLITETGQVR